MDESIISAEPDVLSPDPVPDVSINIDAALEALKSEAPLGSFAKSELHVNGAGDRSIPAPVGRGRSGRGRSRGRGRAHGRRGRG